MAPDGVFGECAPAASCGPHELPGHGPALRGAFWRADDCLHALIRDAHPPNMRLLSLRNASNCRCSRHSP
jgi:hypothetical protein